jgi:hypothetical protein
MDRAADAQPPDPVDHAAAVRRARAEACARLTPAERLERLHVLCAQLAAFGQAPAGRGAP